MKRKLVIGDIHGGFKGLIQVLEKVALTKEDTLVFLGDYVDGWSQSPETIDYLIELKNNYSCYFLRGNHDELLLEWLAYSKDNLEWYQHGGEATVKSYLGLGEETRAKHIAFLKTLHNYHLDTSNRLFVHAGFTNLNGVTKEHFPKMLYWDRTLWETALSLDKNLDKNSSYYPKRLSLYHEIYIGHTPTTRLDITIPVQKANVWNIDTGAGFHGALTVFDVENKTFCQSDLLPTLYPNEKGRN